MLRSSCRPRFRLPAKKVADFAIELAQEFARRFPPGEPSDGTSAKAFAGAVDEILARARSYQDEQKLGFFGKAKFGTEFKHALRDLGFPEPLTDELTGILLVRLSARK